MRVAAPRPNIASFPTLPTAAATPGSSNDADSWLYHDFPPLSTLLLDLDRRHVRRSVGLPLMELLTPRQHLDDRPHSLLSGFRLLSGLEPVSYGIQISFVERFKESFRLLVFGKLF